MSSLILNHPEDEFNLTKESIQLVNWRVIGIMRSGAFYLITSDCKVYHINDLTIEKFHNTIKAGFDLPVVGVMDTIALVCPDCTGTGVSDWISNAIGKVKKVPHHLDLKFQRDPTASLLEAELYSNNMKFSAYFSQAMIPEAHQHCKECYGTGLFAYTLAMDVTLEDVFRMENHI